MIKPGIIYLGLEFVWHTFLYTMTSTYLFLFNPCDVIYCLESKRGQDILFSDNFERLQRIISYFTLNIACVSFQ